MGKKKGKKGKAKDPQLVANEYNEQLIFAALTNAPAKIVGNLAAREANPGLATIEGVLELKYREAELLARAQAVGPDTKEGKGILKEMKLGGAHEFIDVDFKNERNRTALMYASLEGFTEVVSCLLEAKANT